MDFFKPIFMYNINPEPLPAIRFIITRLVLHQRPQIMTTIDCLPSVRLQAIISNRASPTNCAFVSSRSAILASCSVTTLASAEIDG